MMLKQTKIVASISDERCEVEFIYVPKNYFFINNASIANR